MLDIACITSEVTGRTITVCMLGIVCTVSEGKETDVTPWCLGVMTNLCRNNLSLQMFVKGKVCLTHYALSFCYFKCVSHKDYTDLKK